MLTKPTTPFAPSNATGDKIYVAIFIGQTAAAPAITPPAGFTLVPEFNQFDDGGGFFADLRVYEKPATGSEPSTYQFDHASANTEGWIWAVKGPCFLYQTTKSKGNGTSNISVGFYSRSPNNLMMMVSNNWGGGDQPAVSGMTRVGNGTLVDIFDASIAADDTEVKAKTWANGNSGGSPWSTISLTWSPTAVAALPSVLTPWSAWRNASNTGYTTTLTPSGSVSSSSNSQVIQNLDVTGSITITHTGVTVQNCKANAIAADGSTNCTISQCEVDGLSTSTNGIFIGNGTVVDQCNIHHAENGIMIGGTGWTISNNFIHDMNIGTGTPHYDGIQGTGGFTSGLITGNNIQGIDTSCIILQNEFSAYSGVTVVNNLLSLPTGATNIYLRGDKGGGALGSALVRRNMFSGSPSSGYFDITSGPSPLTWDHNMTEKGWLVSAN